MSRLLTAVNELRELLMGPLLVGVVILIIWFFIVKPMLALIPLVAVIVLFFVVINYVFD